MKWKVCKKESKKHKKNAIFANFDNENDDENKKKIFYKKSSNTFRRKIYD